MTREPKKFVGLHGHDGNSIADGFSPPEDHIKFCIKNGLDAHAFTNHGNMNSVAPAYLFKKQLEKKGQEFKVLYGNEFYFVRSLSQWQKDYAENREQKALEKALAKKSTKEKKIKDSIVGDPYSSSTEEAMVYTEEKKELVAEDDEASTTMENEEETKSVKALANKLYRRSHFVMVAKSSEGLKNLYKLTSRSFINGFYKMPRIDVDLIRQYAKGQIVCSTACLGSEFFKIIGDNQGSYDVDTWELQEGAVHSNIISKMESFAWEMVEALGGEENFYLELQMNKLKEQSYLNKYLMDLSKKTGLKCIVTADSHYSDPSHWREREIYKLLGRQQQRSKGNGSEYDTLSAESLPKSIDELKCELYPKNAKQIWDTYKYLSLEGPNKEIYEGQDEFICDAIERTYDIAHELIGKVSPDTSIKLTSLSRMLTPDGVKRTEERKEQEQITDEDELAFKELQTLSFEGLKEKNLHTKEEYVARLNYELDIIHHLKISKYFLIYSKFMKAISETQLVGPARGSGAASLVCYLIHITAVDPVEYGLLFERFLTKYKAGFPDIDCLLPQTLVKTVETYKRLIDINIGDSVIGLDNTVETVLMKNTRIIDENDNMFEIVVQLNNVLGVVVATDKHRFFSLEKKEIYVKDLSVGTLLASNHGNVVIIDIKQISMIGQEIVDITTTGSKSFDIVPFDCVRSNNKVVSVYNYNIDANKKTKVKKYRGKKSS